MNGDVWMKGTTLGVVSSGPCGACVCLAGLKFHIYRENFKINNVCIGTPLNIISKIITLSSYFTEHGVAYTA